MFDTVGTSSILDPLDAWGRLRSRGVGRLAVSDNGNPDIFPINYLASADQILIRTAPGTKLTKLMLNESVALETDHYDAETAWSVVVKGTARHLTDEDSIRAARDSPLWSWMPRSTDAFVVITPTEVTGRAFAGH
ncbi:pyridoxamine 5'-phosphate oxidase family protein [Subtercola sp. PAMC28395]|uniref:pyridoxamine 5'-phosphate oxidase family protein n=1 Tax=Subtercola sp. PAMC28395 TaxID=2846775 RepID=UPI001C0C045C|nr:pyridoxamine 5'-phosphate oxidase family protein [Subtercola sp. PAMC28395]QWT23217.1 pyridoxamine 5'-phosphate oxidase family protein [Subtercola sp. PAMC28395]